MTRVRLAVALGLIWIVIIFAVFVAQLSDVVTIEPMTTPMPRCHTAMAYALDDDGHVIASQPTRSCR